MGSVSHKHHSANICCAPTLWHARARMKTVPRVLCLKTLYHLQGLIPRDILGRCKNVILGSPAGREAQFLFPGPATPRCSCWPPEGPRCKEGEPARFLSRDSKGGVDSHVFTDKTNHFNRKAVLGAFKSQVQPSSQSKHNPFQQAAQAGDIQPDSPPSSHRPDRQPKPPRSSQQKFSGILWSLGLFFLIEKARSQSSFTTKCTSPVEFPSLTISKNKIFL